MVARYKHRTNERAELTSVTQDRREREREREWPELKVSFINRSSGQNCSPLASYVQSSERESERNHNKEFAPLFVALDRWPADWLAGWPSRLARIVAAPLRRSQRQQVFKCKQTNQCPARFSSSSIFFQARSSPNQPDLPAPNQSRSLELAQQWWAELASLRKWIVAKSRVVSLHGPSGIAGMELSPSACQQYRIAVGLPIERPTYSGRLADIN